MNEYNRFPYCAFQDTVRSETQSQRNRCSARSFAPCAQQQSLHKQSTIPEYHSILHTIRNATFQCPRTTTQSRMSPPPVLCHPKNPPSPISPPQILPQSTIPTPAHVCQTRAGGPQSCFFSTLLLAHSFSRERASHLIKQRLRREKSPRGQNAAWIERGRQGVAYFDCMNCTTSQRHVRRSFGSVSFRFCIIFFYFFLFMVLLW